MLRRPMWLLKVLTAAGLAATTLMAERSEAAPQARLVLVRAEDVAGCVEAGALKSIVITRLGYDPFTTAAPSTLLVRVGRTEHELRGSVELVDERASRGSRELSTAAGACDEMQRSLALSISLALDAERTTPPTGAAQFEVVVEPTEPPDRPPPRLEPAAPPAPKSSIGYPTPSDRGPRRSPAPRWLPSASLTALWLTGWAPASAFGGALEARLTRAHFSAGLGGRWAAAGAETGERDVRLRESVAAAQLSTCLQAQPVELCALGVLGSTWARATNVDTPRTDSGLLLAAGARLGLEAPLSTSFSLVAQGEGLVVAQPIRLRVDGATLWSAPRVAGGASFGLRVHFW